jgi:hypothetical protein
MTEEISLTHPMHDFTARHFSFLCEAINPIRLGAQPGTAIRGGLYHAMIQMFSPNDPIPNVPLDPVRALLAAEDDNNARGRDVPRAFSVEPPPSYIQIDAKQRFSFGVSLFGRADSLMPYLFRAVPEMGKAGIGAGRGKFRLIRINETNPLNNSSRVIMQHQRVHEPFLTITHQRIREEARIRRSDEVTLNFITPMRLIEDGRLVHKPKLGTLLMRLIDRAQALDEHYSPLPEVSATRERWRMEWERIREIGQQIDEIGPTMDATEWVNIESFSRARGRSTPIGGFIGKARWQIHSPEVLIWLLWGQSLHVGKNVAKGDGYFKVQ